MTYHYKMKKLFLFFVFILISAIKGFSQSPVPAIDSKEYEDLKQQGLLPKDMTLSNPQSFSPTLADFQRLGITHQMRRPGGSPAPASGGGCSCYIAPDASYTLALTPNDDGSTSSLTIPFNFCLYGTQYTSLFINNNGNVSFDNSYSTFSSSAFPSASYVMVAPFWGDVDTRGAGTVQYKITSTAMYVNWVGVGYYPQMTDKVNTFQLIITNGSDPILPPGNNIAFCYGDMQWTTGSASQGVNGFGGVPSTVGVNKGDGTSYIQMGRFDSPGAGYFGAYASNDGIDWLDNKSFYFNSCSSTNLPPVASGFNNCDTIKICGTGDSLILNGLFLSPEIGQTTTISVNLNGTPHTTVVSNIPGNTATAQVMIVANAANAGNNIITFTATDNGTPAGITVVNLNVFVDTVHVPNFHPAITGNSAFCFGDSSLLTVNPSTYASYMWNTGSAATSIYAHTSGHYWVTSTLNGCYKTSFININGYPAPTPAITQVPLVPCTITTTLSVDSTIYSTYHWSTGSTSTSITAGAGTYTLSVTDAHGCTAVSPAVVIATPPAAPVITAHNDTLICSGATANLSLTFGGSSIPPTCGLSSSGACTGTASIAIVGTGTGTNTSTSYPAPYGNFYTSAKHQFLFTAAEMHAAGFSGGKVDQLDFNVSQINGTTTYHEFTIKMGCTNLTALGTTWESGLVQVYNPHTFSVAAGWNAHVFDNAFDWDGISNVIVEICFNESPPFPNYTDNSISPSTTTAFVSCLYSQSDSYDMCPDLTNFISQSFDRPNVQFHYCGETPNPASYSYLWTALNGNITNPAVQSTTAHPAVTTRYKVTATNIIGGCSSSDSVNVVIMNVNSITITPSGPYCVNGNNDTLHTNLPPGIGTWSGPGIIDSLLGIFKPSAALAGPLHRIIYTISGACGSGADTANIIVVPQPNAAITPVGGQCSTGSPITLSAATPGGTWTGTGITSGSAGTFDPAIAGIGNHIITYSITTPCASSDTVTINVVSHLDATITQAGPFCTSSPVITLHAIDIGGVWSGVGVSDSLIGTFSPLAAGAGSHPVTYTISGLCGATDTKTIVISASPIISITENKTEGCEPTTIDFTGITDQPGGVSAWTFGDGHNAAVLTTENTYQHYGYYNVSFTYTNTTGCTTVVTKDSLINIHSQPHAAFNADPQPATIVYPEIQYTDKSTGQINSWKWSFGPLGILGSSLLQNPSFVYADTGSFPVQLIVTNTFGCVDTAKKITIIDPVMVFYAPNAFTPDGNEKNDLFAVKGDGIDKNNFTVAIFDRWGELVYQSADMMEGWNGKKNNTGDILASDVYVWKIDFKDFKGAKHSNVGRVTLVK